VIGARFGENEPTRELWRAIRRRTFPGMVSNHHLGSLLGLLLAAIEMNAFKAQYQPQVLANARAFALALRDQGLRVEGDPALGYTQTHQVLVNVGHARACAVARALEERNIIVNYQALPEDESFTASSGLRLGVAEMTRFGMREADFATLAPLFADAVRGVDHVAEQVARFRGRFQTLHYCFDAEALVPLRERLRATC
jgi:glycine/serine hydroxymethyltransferase